MRADKVNTGGAILIFVGTFARIYRGTVERTLAVPLGVLAGSPAALTGATAG